MLDAVDWVLSISRTKFDDPRVSGVVIDADVIVVAGAKSLRPEEDIDPPDKLAFEDFIFVFVDFLNALIRIRDGADGHDLALHRHATDVHFLCRALAPYASVTAGTGGEMTEFDVERLGGSEIAVGCH